MRTNVITDLDSELRVIIPQAKKIYIAVALCSQYAESILDFAKSKTEIKVVTGVDLPTPVQVLENLRHRYGGNARVYSEVFYHPKVYLFQMDNNEFVAFVGSANLTKGGTSDNIEISYRVSSQVDCLKLVDWFHEIFDNSLPITDAFIDKYNEYQLKWFKIKDEYFLDLKEFNKHITQDNLEYFEGNTYKLYALFWTSFNEIASHNLRFKMNFKIKRTATIRGYQDYSIGKGFHIVLKINLYRQKAFVGVYFDRVDLYWEFFNNYKLLIEKKLRQELEWNDEQTKGSAYLAYENIDIRDKECWTRITEWMLETSVLIKETFVEFTKS